MDRDELTAWALKNGWQMLAGAPSLTRPNKPKEPILRLVFKVTVVALEVRKPSGKWDKVVSAAYGAVQADEEGGLPQGLGFESVPSILGLMRENKDRQVFAAFKS